MTVLNFYRSKTRLPPPQKKVNEMKYRPTSRNMAVLNYCLRKTRLTTRNIHTLDRSDRSRSRSCRTDKIDHDLNHLDRTEQIDHDLDQIDRAEQIDHDLDQIDRTEQVDNLNLVRADQIDHDLYHLGQIR